MLPGTRDDDDVVLAGSPHAPVRARRIHARTPSQGTHARTHRAHARTPGPRTHAPGPCTLARTRSPCPLARKAQHTRTGSPRPLGLRARTHRVPMPARLQGPYASTHRAMHARSHQAMHARSPRAMHARSHRAPTPARSLCTHAQGPCAHARSGSPRPLARGVPMHVCTGPMHVRSHRAYARVLAPGLCTRARTGPMHSRSHRAYARALAPAPMPARLWGPHARAPDPCTCACCIPCCM